MDPPLNFVAQLGIDLRALGYPVPAEDLAPGEFVLTIDQEISQTISSSRVSLWADGFSEPISSGIGSTSDLITDMSTMHVITNPTT